MAAVCVGFASGVDGAGFALLGERTKYLAVAPQRVKRMQCTSGEFFVQWYGSAGEAVHMMVLPTYPNSLAARRAARLTLHPHQKFRIAGA